MTDLATAHFQRGQRRAKALFSVTRVGAILKLLYLSWAVYLLVKNHRFDYISEERFDKLLSVTIIALSGLLGLAGSYAMLRRKKKGLYIYLISQLITGIAITWAMRLHALRFGTPEKLILLLIYVNIVVFVSLYTGNRKYLR